MTVADLCDVVYAMLVNRLERFAVMGGYAEFEKARTEFDRALVAEVKRRPLAQRVVLEALGVKRAG